MIDNGNSRPKFDTNLNLSYGVKCRFFVLIWSLYDLSFGHFLPKMTIKSDGRNPKSLPIKNTISVDITLINI